MKNLVNILFISFLMLGCIRGGRDVRQSNQPLAFVVKKNGESLSDAILKNLKVYYFKNGNKYYTFQYSSVVPTIEYNVSDNNTIIQYLSTYIANESATGIKDYYLEYPNGDIDTVYVDYQKLDHDQAIKDPCYCYFKLVEIKFNGVRASYDPEIKSSSVYRFDKLN